MQRIQYAKTDSEVISKMRGTYGDKDKKKDKKKKAQEQAANANKKPAMVSAVDRICIALVSIVSMEIFNLSVLLRSVFVMHT